MTQWQKIETAPKDGTKILLLFKHDKNVSVALWDNFYAPGGMGHSINFSNNGAWVEPISGEVLCMHYDFPTNWMPLPKAPPNSLEL